MNTNKYNSESKCYLEDILNIDFFKVLTDPVRLKIIEYLSYEGAKSISDISELFIQDRSVISRHLDLLFKQGIVKKSKVNRFVIYEMNGTEILHKFNEITEKLRKVLKNCNLS